MICFALSVLLKQRVLPKHQPAAALLQSHLSVQLRSLLMGLPGILSPHSHPLSNLCPRIPQVQNLSLALRCLYLDTLASASRKWLQCPLSLILMPSQRKLRRCWRTITLVRKLRCCLLPFSLVSIVKLFIFWNGSQKFLPLSMLPNQANVCLGRLSLVWLKVLSQTCWPGPNPGTSSAWRAESPSSVCSSGFRIHIVWRNSWTWNA